MVEDDPDQIMMYEVEIQNQNYELITASNRKEALAKAKKEQPDVILLDMLLGETKGIDVLKDLKKEPKTKDIDVIFLTNFKNEELSKEAKEKGACDYLIKSDHVPEQVIKKAAKYFKK